MINTEQKLFYLFSRTNCVFCKPASLALFYEHRNHPALNHCNRPCIREQTSPFSRKCLPFQASLH